MEQKKKRGAKPKPEGEKKKVVQFYLKEKYHGKFIKEVSPIVKKYSLWVVIIVILLITKHTLLQTTKYICVMFVKEHLVIFKLMDIAANIKMLK